MLKFGIGWPSNLPPQQDTAARSSTQQHAANRINAVSPAMQRQDVHNFEFAATATRNKWRQCLQPSAAATRSKWRQCLQPSAAATRNKWRQCLQPSAAATRSKWRQCPCGYTRHVHGMIWYGMTWQSCGMVWYRMVWYGRCNVHTAGLPHGRQTQPRRGAEAAKRCAFTRQSGRRWLLAAARHGWRISCTRPTRIKPQA